jgi:predicted lipoprotein
MKNAASISVILLLLFISCNRKKDHNTSVFDRKLLLENYATNLIIPSYGNFQQKVNALHQAAQHFIQQSDSGGLIALRLAWTEAVAAFQFCNSYNFGPAVSNTGTLTENIATFPVNEVLMEQFISNENYSLNNFARDTRGLFGVEYLIFDEQAITKFNGSEGYKRKSYLSAIVQDIKNKTDQVVSGWSSYQNTFINATGTDAGSSTSLLFNNFLIGYEFIKNYKLGLPLGLRAGQAAPEPFKVEAYYSGISTLLIRLNFESIVQIYFGNDSAGTAGTGFDDYLRAIEGGASLVDETFAQMQQIQTALDNMPPGRLSDIIISNPQPAVVLHAEMQKLTRYIKSDMSSLLGISITYSSGDGD